MNYYTITIYLLDIFGSCAAGSNSLAVWPNSTIQKKLNTVHTCTVISHLNRLVYI